MIWHKIQGAGGGGATDPFFSNVTILAHFDGANGGSSLIDSTGNCILDGTEGSVDATTTTSQLKFGTASLDCSSGNAYVAIASATTGVMDFGTNDFTIEAWVYRTASARQFICDSRQSTGNAGSLQFVIDSDQLTWSASTGVESGRTTTTVPLNQWVHVALCNRNNIARMYINGEIGDTSSLTINLVDGVGGAYPPVIAASGFTRGNARLTGYLDDFRITKGVARYFVDFTPPTEPFPDS